MDSRVDFVVNDGRAYLHERLRKRVPPAEVVVLDAYTGIGWRRNISQPKSSWDC